MKYFLGVDPGANGAAVIIDSAGDFLFTQILFYKSTEGEIAEWFLNHAAKKCSRAMLEKVSAMPKQGVSSTFKFGQNYGFLRGCLMCSKIPFDDSSPQRWQKAMGCMTAGDKNVTKAKAQQLFPRDRITHANADALLIAEYCRRLHLGMI